MTLSSAERREIARYVRDLQEAKHAIDWYSDTALTAIAELVRRRSEKPDPDGFPAGGLGSGGSSTSESTSTESAALRGLPEDEKLGDDWRRHRVPDPIGDAVEEALALIVLVAAASKRLRQKTEIVVHANKRQFGRKPTVGSCPICEKTVTGIGNDRMRSGYCPACFRAWCRDGRPSYESGRRAPWERRRASQMGDGADPAVPVASEAVPTVSPGVSPDVLQFGLVREPLSSDGGSLVGQ